jgi:citronellol/citronellal dehydrogenase
MVFMSNGGFEGAPRRALAALGRVASGHGPQLHGKTLFITGASRGIGLAIARRAARDGANRRHRGEVHGAESRSCPAPSTAPPPKVEAAGGQALAIACDIREEEQVRDAVASSRRALRRHRHPVNNASAIWLRGALDTPMKRFDLMQQVNSRGSFLCAQACLPHLLQASNPHILTLAPPPTLAPKWWGRTPATRWRRWA